MLNDACFTFFPNNSKREHPGECVEKSCINVENRIEGLKKDKK